VGTLSLRESSGSVRENTGEALEIVEKGRKHERRKRFRVTEIMWGVRRTGEELKRRGC
jgi:hypothetical protein